MGCHSVPIENDRFDWIWMYKWSWYLGTELVLELVLVQWLVPQQQWLMPWLRFRHSKSATTVLRLYRGCSIAWEACVGGGNACYDSLKGVHRSFFIWGRLKHFSFSVEKPCQSEKCYKRCSIASEACVGGGNACYDSLKGVHCFFSSILVSQSRSPVGQK